MANRGGELPTKRRARGPTSESATFVLTVVEGPDAGATFTIEAKTAARVLVGQGAVCAIRLSDPEVSRRHVSLRATRNAIELFDLGSTNGTTVNGVHAREVVLRGGESVRVGRTVLAIARGEPVPASPLEGGKFSRVLGVSRQMRALCTTLERLAASDVPVLLEGETGTGKELVAGELHERSRRTEGPFVILSTTACDAAAIEHELFDGDGSVKRSEMGTLYVEEAAHLPLECQRRLLLLIDSTTLPRLVCGTRVDLDRAVVEGRFVEALYDKLASGRLELPPLREREEDIGLLATTFWKRLAGADAELPNDFLARFEHYPWPGNVTELLQAVEARFVRGELASVRPDRASRKANDFLDALVDQDLPFARARQVVLEEFQRRYVEALLGRHGGNVRRAAAASGLARRYFQLLRARAR